MEREAAYLGINSGSDNVALLSRKEPRCASSIIIFVHFDSNGGKCSVFTLIGEYMHKHGIA